MCVSGGLTAVLWTDAIQTIILVIGATVLAFISENPNALRVKCHSKHNISFVNYYTVSVGAS